jgi:hypothetical protein
VAEFKVAHKRVDITPTADSGNNRWMSGYGWKPRGNRHFVVNRLLWAHCAVIPRRRERRFLRVFGASGCGKSSLLRAGLVARLSAERESDSAPVDDRRLHDMQAQHRHFLFVAAVGGDVARPG